MLMSISRTYSSSEMRTFFSQGPPVEDEGQMKSLQQDIPPNFYNLRVNEGAHCPTRLSPSIQSTPILGVGTAHPETCITGIHYANLQAMHPPGPTGQTTFPSFPPGFGPGGFEDYVLATVIPTADPTRNWCHERAPMSVPQDQGHEFTRVHKTLDTSVPSALPGIPGTPTVVQKQQKSLRNLPQQFQKMRKGRTATPSRSSRRQADVHDPPRRQHLCKICGKEYAQRQGLTRHHLAKHEASLCIYCREFKSGRPYLRLLREHLERQHPDVDPNAAVEVVKRNGRRATYLARGPAVSPPTSEYDRRIRTEFQLHPPIPSPPAVNNRSSVSLPAFPLAACEAQFEFTGPTIMKSKRGNDRQFEAHHPRYARTPFVFTEEPEPSQTAKDSGTYAPIKLRQDGSIAANASSYPITAPVPTLAPHVSGFRSSLIHVTPTIDPSGPTYVSRTLPPDDGIRSNGLAESPNGTPYAGIESHRYRTRPSYGN